MAVNPNITKEFLETALKCPVRTFKVTEGTNPGDNYMSVMYAIEVEPEAAPTRHLLLKAYPNHPGRQDYLDKVNIFSKEIKVYEILVPELESIRNPDLDQELRLPLPSLISAKAIDHKKPSESKNDGLAKDGFTNYLLMEDIRKTYGYKMADRCEGLDLEHAKLVMGGLALLHAHSWAYKQLKRVPKLLQKFPFLVDLMYDEASFGDFAELMKTMERKALQDIASILTESSEAYEAAKTFFEKDSMTQVKNFFLSDGIDETLVEGWLRIKPAELPGYSKEPWLVACHGDCWVNNILFLYDKTGKPTKLTFVDLQIVREACPTTDLAYFLYSSTSPQLRKEHQDELLQVYHDKFVQYCRLLNSEVLPGFNYAALKRRFRRAGTLGFIMCIPLLQVVLKPQDEAVDLDTCTSETNDMAEIFSSVMGGGPKNSKLQLWLSGITQELYDDGVL